MTPVFKNPGRGRPKSEVEKVLAGYKIQSTITRNQKVIEQELHRKGRFIIATNNLDKNTLSDEALFAAYKEQQGVERGFRFLKDPWFMVDSFFVKKRQRIEALMMVMTLCLLVYNYAQHKLRKSLKLANETLPNQLTTSVFNGGISPDSTSYLRMANFDLPYFSTWPWGYPVLIKFTSLLLDNINLFWASKILNIACIFGNLIILKSLFKGYSLQSYYYIFLTSSFLLISNYTWSENPFIFFNLLFIWSVIKVIENDNKLLFSVMVVLSAVSAFLVRYIGIFHLLSLGLLFLYFLFTKNKKQSFRFLFLCLISGTFIFGYFLLNKTLTGSFTGGRVPAAGLTHQENDS